MKSTYSPRVFLPLLLLLLLGGQAARAQNLTRLEYFYDTDPGYGLGNVVEFPTPAAAQNFTFTASLAGLASGYHTMYTRVQSQQPGRKVWSLASVRPVYVGPVGVGLDNLSYLEYFFDTDPGYRLGHRVDFPAPGTSLSHTFVADLSGLSPGFHTLYTRVRNSAGAWSLSQVRPIYVGPTSGLGGAAPDLTYAEYYIDTDPGYRQGTRVNFPTPGTSVAHSFVADLSSVSNGFHTLFVRVRNADGGWSLSALKPFLRSGVTASSPALSITRAEYYIDADPGHGQGTAVPITPGTSINQTFTADLSSVSNGFHTLFVRVMDQSRAWSIVSVQPFVRQGSIAGAARPLITKFRYQVFPKTSNVASGPAEYYVLPAPAPAADVDVTFPTNVCVTAAGSYILRVAALDANNVPAVEYAHEFAVATPSKLNPNLPATLESPDGQPLTLTAAPAGPGGSYLWSTGATTQSITVSTAGTYSVALTSPQGCVGTASTVVSFPPPPVVYNLLHNQCLLSDPITSTGAGVWQPLMLNGQTVAALNDQGHALGQVRVEFAVMNGGGTRQDGRGHKYLDRNWRFIAQHAFPGQSVQVRFYGLPAEYEKLQAADPGQVSSYASLRLTQYSGPNEDCDLANNSSASAQLRLLTPLSTAHTSQNYFVAEATVTDHFSEFYLHGGSVPLPVQLTSFGALRRGRAVQAQWATATEHNSAYFVVEAANSPRAAFAEVGRAAAAGHSSSPRSYSLLERNVPATGGVRYYRLRQVDLDGSSSYSPVAAVRLAAGETPLTLRAAPNPFHQGELRAFIDAAAAGQAQLQLSDLAGRRLLARELMLTGGEQAVALPELAPLPPGVYVLSLRVGTELRQLKILKE